MIKSNAGIPDLNLLRVFLAIWDLRGLTAAGERLGLTQPAVSHALRRLRTLFEDPLFVRTPGGMMPTDAAYRLYPPLAQAFSIIHEAVQQLGKFDPATAQRVFRISMSDMSEFFFLPPLGAFMEREARGIRIEVLNVRVEAVSAAMRAGEIDLALGYVPWLDAECVSQTLFVDEYVCVVRANHPLSTSPARHGSLIATSLGESRDGRSNWREASVRTVHREMGRAATVEGRSMKVAAHQIAHRRAKRIGERRRIVKHHLVALHRVGAHARQSAYAFDAREDLQFAQRGQGRHQRRVVLQVVFKPCVEVRGWAFVSYEVRATLLVLHGSKRSWRECSHGHYLLREVPGERMHLQRAMNGTIVAGGRFERGEFVEIKLQYARRCIDGRRDARIDALRHRLVHDQAT